MGRVAQKRHARGGHGMGQRQAQRIAVARAGQRKLPQKTAKARAQHLKVLRIRQGVDRGGIGARFAPDDQGAVAGQRQDRQRAGGHEELMRDAVVRLFVIHHADQRRLTIGPCDTLDARALRRAAAAAIGPHRQSCAQGLAALKRQSDAGRRHRLPRNAGVVHHRDRRIGGRRLQQRAAQMAVFDHLAHRAFFDLGMIEMHEHGRGAGAGTPIGDLDLKHRLGVIRDVGPDADAFHQPDRGQRQRIGAPIKGGVLKGLCGLGVNHGHAQSCAAEGQGKGGAVQPPADDRDIVVKIHGPRYDLRAGIVHAPNGR